MRTQKNYSELELRNIFNIDDEYEINMEQRETLIDYLNVSPFKIIENAGVQLHRNDLNETFIINEHYDLFNSVNSKTFRQYGMIIHATKFDDFILIGNVSYRTMILNCKTSYTVQIGNQPPYKEIRTKTIYSDAIARHIRKFLFDIINVETPKIDVDGRTHKINVLHDMFEIGGETTLYNETDVMIEMLYKYVTTDYDKYVRELIYKHSGGNKHVKNIADTFKKTTGVDLYVNVQTFGYRYIFPTFYLASLSNAMFGDAEIKKARKKYADSLANRPVKTFTCPYEFCAEMLDIKRSVFGAEMLDDINILVRAITTNIPDFLKEKYSVDLLKPIELSHMSIAIEDLLTNYNVEFIFEDYNIKVNYCKFIIDVNNRLLPQMIREANQKYLSNKDTYQLDFEIN